MIEFFEHFFRPPFHPLPFLPGSDRGQPRVRLLRGARAPAHAPGPASRITDEQKRGTPIERITRKLIPALLPRPAF